MNYAISITGELGSGKSTVAKKLLPMFDATLHCTGDVFRAKAASMNLTLDELSALCEKDPEIDREIDRSSAEIDLDSSPVVIDSRMAWHFAKNDARGTFKIYLTCDADAGASRIFNAKRPEERTSSVSEMIKANRARRQSERERYMNYYGVDCMELSQFDFVLDTTIIDVNEAAERTAAAIRAFYSGAAYERFLIAPCNISTDGAKDGGAIVLKRGGGGEFSALSGGCTVDAAKKDGLSLVPVTEIITAKL